MNLFETLIHPDREEHPERAEVARAANLLQIGEFQLLQLAYKDWFGTDLPSALIDKLFADHMLRNRVPHWARHYARRIIALDAAGMLNDRDPAYHCYDTDYRTRIPDGVSKFCIAATVVTVCVFGSIWLGHVSIPRDGSVFPPYFHETEFNRATKAPSPSR